MNPLSILKGSQKYNTRHCPVLTQVRMKHSVSFSISPASPKANVRREMTDPTIADTRSQENGIRPTTPTFLLSPLETLLQSIHDQENLHLIHHDVIQAYAVLSMRFRSFLAQDHQTLSSPILDPVKSHSSELAGCLKRDIKLAFRDPFIGLHQDFVQDSVYSVDFVAGEDELQRALDLSMLCHHALHVVSDIFSSPLYLLFSVDDLAAVLQEILTICVASNLPVYNMNKTISLSIWILSTQQLPIALLVSQKPSIISAIQRALDNELEIPEIVLDGLKTIHNILSRTPEPFIRPFSNFLPVILSLLLSTSLTHRTYAAYALSGLAFARLQTNDALYPPYTMSSIIHSFIRKSNKSADKKLTNTIKGAIENVDSFWEGKGTSWAVTVVNCVAILCGSSLFTETRTIKLVVSSIEFFGAHSRSTVRSLVPLSWRAVHWAYCELLRKNAQMHTVDEVTESAFNLIIQELKDDNGMSLAASLLEFEELQSGSTNIDVIGRVLKISKIMVNGCERREGIMLIHRLVSAIGCPTRNSSTDLKERHFGVPIALVNGTLLDTDLGQLKNVIHQIQRPSIASARQLSDSELLYHWDEVAAIWVTFIESCLLDITLEISPELLHIWQALLLVQSQLTQGNRHLTAVPSFSLKATSIITRFAVQVDDVEAQVQHLKLIRKLWIVMKNVFASSWLPSPAETILVSILKCVYALESDNVIDVWGELCTDLISVGIPSLVAVLDKGGASQADKNHIRQLWLVVRKFVTKDDDIAWQEFMPLLAMPFNAWVMSESDLNLWNEMFQKFLSSAKRSSMQCTMVSLEFLRHLDDNGFKALQLNRLALSAILLNVTFVHEFPVTKFFSLVDDFLYSCYHAGDEDFSNVLVLLHQLGNVILSTSKTHILFLLSLMQKSLCIWIGDELSLLQASDHTHLVQKLYCEALLVLAELEPSATVLETLSPFLVSSFARVSDGAYGPLAFEQFWRTNYHGRDELIKLCPINIQACLKAWSDFVDDSLADQFSLFPPSQSSINSLVPDSQSGQLHHDLHFANLLSRSSIDTPRFTQQKLTNSVVNKVFNTDYQSQVYFLQENKKPNGSKILMEVNLKDPAHTRLPVRLASEKADAVSISRTRLKRRNDIADKPTNPKRRQIEAIPNSVTLAFADNREELSHQPALTLTTEPISPSSSLATLLHSQSSRMVGVRPMRMIMDCVELPTYKEVLSRWQLRSPAHRSPRASTEPCSSPSSIHGEAGLNLSMSTTACQISLPTSDATVPETEFEASSNSEVNNEAPSNLHHGLLANRRHRSQTAPETGLAVLRTPLRRAQTTSARFDALQRAYAAVADSDGVSQIPVQDLVKATKMVNQIHSVLHDQISKRLGGSS